MPGPRHAAARIPNPVPPCERTHPARSPCEGDHPTSRIGPDSREQARRRRLARDLFLQGLKQALFHSTESDALPLPSLLGRHFAASGEPGADEPTRGLRRGAIRHGV
jgi:hypothetical protein